MKPTTRIKLHRLPYLALLLATGTAMAGTDGTVTPPPAVPTTPDWLKISGYAAISYTYTDTGTNRRTFADGNTPFDATKVIFQANQGPLGAYASLFYTPGISGQEAGILDAYATYKVGDVTFTGGKYLSYLGYEAFDTVNMTQITYANTLGAVPAYHDGIKVDYATETFGAGANVSDSIKGRGFWAGDQNLSNGLGYEGYITYKGVDKLTLWAGFAYENSVIKKVHDFVTYDGWASYDITPQTTVAAEVAYHDGDARGTQGLGFLKYSFTKQFSTILRVGFDEISYGGRDHMSYTICPTYAFTDNFLIRAELTCNSTKTTGDSTFSGVQALLKF